MVLDEPEDTLGLFRFDSIAVRRIALDFKEQSVLLDEIPTSLPRNRIASNGVKNISRSNKPSANRSKRNRIVSMPEFSTRDKESLAIADQQPPKSEKRKSRWFSKAFGLASNESDKLFDALPYQSTDPNTIKPVKEEVPWATIMEHRAKNLHLDKDLPSLHKNEKPTSSPNLSESSIPPRRRPLWDAYPGGRPVGVANSASARHSAPIKLWETPPSESSDSSINLVPVSPSSLTDNGPLNTVQNSHASETSLDIQEPFRSNTTNHNSQNNLKMLPNLNKSLPPSVHELVLPSKSSGLPSLRYEPPIAEYKPPQVQLKLPKTRQLPGNHPYRISRENVASNEFGRRYASAPQAGMQTTTLNSKPLPSVQPHLVNKELPPIEKKLPPIKKQLPTISTQVKELPQVVGPALTTKPKSSPFSQRNKAVATMIPSLSRTKEAVAPFDDEEEDKFDPLPSPTGEYFYQTLKPRDVSTASTIKALSPRSNKPKHIIVDDDDDDIDALFGSHSPEFVPLSDSEDYDIPSYLQFINNAFGVEGSVREVSPVPDYLDVMKTKQNNTGKRQAGKHKVQLSNDSGAPNYVSYANSNDQSSFSDDSLFSDHKDALDQSPPQRPRLHSANAARQPNLNNVANRNSMISNSSSNSGISLKDAKRAMAHEIAQHEFKYPLDTHRNYDDYTRFIYPKGFFDQKRGVSTSTGTVTLRLPPSSPSKSAHRNFSSTN